MKPKQKTKALQPNEKISFTAHLEELRKRLVITLSSVGLGFILCYGFSEQILTFLRHPLKSDLIFIAPTEALFVNLKVSLFAAVFLCSPIILHQMWRFVAPGLVEKERKFFLPVLFSSTFFFLLGGAFAYLLLLPISLQFLLGYGSKNLEPMITVSSYLSFCSKLILACGAIFQTPIVIYFLARLDLVHSRAMGHSRHYAILFSFVMAAILTPPDFFTQLLLALPLMGIYELSILIVKMVERRKGKIPEEEAEQVEENIEEEVLKEEE